MSPISRLGTGVAGAILVYGALYLAARTAHRNPYGRWTIETGSRFSCQLFAPLAHLEKHLRDREIPRAEPMIESALVEARATGRTVMLALGSTSCLPCRQLEHFLAEQSAIVDRHFVVVKVNIDDELNGGDRVRARYRVPRMRPDTNEYLPWIAFLDHAGELSVTADDGPPGRIGIPQGGAEDRAWFLAMLRRAHPAITDAELVRLETAAVEYHQALWGRHADVPDAPPAQPPSVE